MFADVKVGPSTVEDRSDWPLERRLEARIVDGDREGLEADLDAAMAQGIAPLSIINDILLAGMKTVGELFASGEMQLPFVLQSAETMKTSVAYLEPHMEKVEGGGGKGRLVLATVKGDVHDIGKNLVDIILTNNGYEVHNLGIKVAITEMIEKALEIGADAIGMSGLLVKSTLIMRDNLQELNARGLAKIPVLLGGAALTRTYVERDLREIYDGRLFYGKDAFEGLRVMDRLGELKRSGEEDPLWGREPGGRQLPARTKVEVDPSTIPARSPEVALDNPVFVPPFVGARIVKGLSLDDIAAYINETALFRNQWQFRPENGETDDEFKDRIRPILRPVLQREVREHPHAASCLRVLLRQRRRQRPRHLEGRHAHGRMDAAQLSPSDRGALLVYRRLLPAGRVGRDRLRRVPHRHDGGAGQRDHGRVVRRQQVPGLLAAARAWVSRWPRRSPSTGTTASAKSGASPARTGRHWPVCSASNIEAGGIRGAIPRAPISRTTPRLRSCWAPSTSASSATKKRVGSTNPNRPPRRSSATTRARSTSSPAETHGVPAGTSEARAPHLRLLMEWPRLPKLATVTEARVRRKPRVRDLEVEKHACRAFRPTERIGTWKCG